LHPLLMNPQKEIVAKVKRDAAIQKDITPLEIESTISYLLRDTMLPKYLTEDREIEVSLRFNDKSKDSLDTVKSMQLASNGKSLPIETLSTFNIQKGVPQIRRQNKNTMLGIKITYEDKDMREISSIINSHVNDMSFPSGYGWSKGRRFQEMEESDSSTQYAGILAATFVLLLMGVLFESFILPFSIITSVPMAFIGSFWLIWMTGTTFTPFAGTGILILIGIVVNNGIVLIDHINSLRKQGMPKEQAIIQGSRDRSRPILMTAITTIMGLVPLAAGQANLVGIPYAPLAIVVIGGLTTSTLLTLFVVPVIYSLLDSLREFMSAYTFSFMKSGEKGQKTVEGKAV
jgi:hydrophobic/amphiphilic exporter-1 (mainly G- bacteria), HAE1 family